MHIVNPFDDRPHRMKTKAMAAYALLAVANAAAWLWAWTAYADRPALLGTAFLAYMFGLRHAFDADHIAAIDSVVRKLMQEGRAPCSAGLFFSLGHSTIVILASVAVAAAAAAMQARFDGFRDIGGTIGTSVSALFLLVIGLANLFVLKGILSIFLHARRGGKIVEGDLDTLLAGCGFLARMFRPVFRLVSRSWHMYPIGFLFGLGFDTATEIGLLGISTAQAAGRASVWTILVFPALFTAGMSLMDFSDSVLMTGAYRWAFISPTRKLWYNLAITAASIVVAVFIGAIEALGLIGDKLGRSSRFWGAVGQINDGLANFGYALVGVFVACWLVSMLVYRARGHHRQVPGKA